MKRIPHPQKHKNKSEPKFILHYRLEEVVGHGKSFHLTLITKILTTIVGAWGKVKRGWDCQGSGRPVAIKILSKKRISRKIRNGLERIKK